MDLSYFTADGCDLTIISDTAIAVDFIATEAAAAAVKPITVVMVTESSVLRLEHSQMTCSQSVDDIAAK